MEVARGFDQRERGDGLGEEAGPGPGQQIGDAMEALRAEISTTLHHTTAVS